mgnify:CR=1 FL=1
MLNCWRAERRVGRGVVPVGCHVRVRPRPASVRRREPLFPGVYGEGLVAVHGSRLRAVRLAYAFALDQGPRALPGEQLHARLRALDHVDQVLDRGLQGDDPREQELARESDGVFMLPPL